MGDVSLNTTYAGQAAAGMESDDMTWDECYNKMLSFEDSLFEMDDSPKDPGEDGKHAAPGELRTDLPNIWRNDSVQSSYQEEGLEFIPPLPTRLHEARHRPKIGVFSYSRLCRQTSQSNGGTGPCKGC